MGDEINELYRSIRGVELRYEDQRTIEVTTLDPVNRASRGYQPPAMISLAEKRCKTGGRIKARQRKPVYGTIAPHKRGRRAIADQGIVFDSLVRGHRSPVACVSLPINSITHDRPRAKPAPPRSQNGRQTFWCCQA